MSPATAEAVAATVAAGGAAYVDGGIIGPPPREPGTTRLYLSGDRASEVARLFLDSRVEPVVVDAGRFAASATKMTYAAWTKVSAALLLSVARGGRAARRRRRPARRVGRSRSRTSRTGWPSARRSATAKGWRWEAEMREIAATFAAVGVPSGFGESAADVFGRFPRPGSEATATPTA